MHILLVLLLAQGTITTGFSQYPPLADRSCRCEKGDRGEKGDAGVCPTNLDWKYSVYSRDCLGPRINLERLSHSIRQLIIETKKIGYRNTRITPCVCPASPASVASIPSISNPAPLDYNMYIRLKGNKGDRGDIGASCSSNCRQTAQTNVQVFSTLKAALDTSVSSPDHTYVHIVDETGHLQGVFIRLRGRLIQLRLDNEHALSVPSRTIPTTLPIPKPKCTTILGCQKLHIFALGPHTRQMCHFKYSNASCSKLSDYDDLCARISERHRLQGFYRALMSTSTQWLAKLFAGVCLNAKIINMQEQTLFDTFDEIFQHKSPQSDILDVQGQKPQFQYWWHGSFPNGTASRDTCLDWSHRNSSLSGIASRLSNDINPLFHYQYIWPCSISDSNMGILCIETNCDKRNYYKH